MFVDYSHNNKDFLEMGIGLTKNDIDQLIASLREMKQNKDHFHLSNDSLDIEIYSQENQNNHNTTLFGGPIKPNR